MKKGINQWLFPDSMNVEQCMVMAKDAGFDGLEICMGENAPKSEAGSLRLDEETGIAGYRSDLALDTREEDVKAISESAKKVGIEICSVATALNFRYPLTSPDTQTRAKGIEVLKKSLQSAALLGAEVALVIPGIVTPEVSYGEAVESSEAALRELLPTARETGVRMALENVWNKFLLSPLEFRDFIDRIDDDCVCALFDVANILAYGYPDQWIDALGSRIRSVHIKDFMTSVGNINGFVNLFEGDIDWPAVMKSLRNVGYDGYLTVETIPAYKYCPESRIYESSIALDRLLNL